VVQDPAQCHLRHVQAGRHQRLEPIGQLDPLFEGQSGKGLADVERLAAAVVVAVVGRGKAGLGRELA